MSDQKTCKDCKAFILDEEQVAEGEMPGVCILNPPQMIVGKEFVEEGDKLLTEEIVLSAFPKVDGLVTRCMKLIPITLVVIALSSCAPNENLGGRSILEHTFSNYWRQATYENSAAYYRDHEVCRTYKDPWQRIRTKCY